MTRERVASAALSRLNWTHNINPIQKNEGSTWVLRFLRTTPPRGVHFGAQPGLGALEGSDPRGQPLEVVEGHEGVLELALEDTKGCELA